MIRLKANQEEEKKKRKKTKQEKKKKRNCFRVKKRKQAFRRGREAPHDRAVASRSLRRKRGALLVLVNDLRAGVPKKA